MTPPQYHRHDEQTTSKEREKLESVQMCVYWLKAVIYQGGRVFEAASQPEPHLNSAVLNSRGRMEQQFFLTACDKARRWVEPMRLTTPEFEQFMTLEKNITRVRGIREHDEKYSGMGINKKNEKQPAALKRAKSDTPLRLNVSASVTVHEAHSGRLLLGGTVDVAEVVRAAEALVKQLIPTQHAYWNKRAAETGGSIEQQTEVAKSYYARDRF